MFYTWDDLEAMESELEPGVNYPELDVRDLYNESDIEGWG